MWQFQPVVGVCCDGAPCRILEHDASAHDPLEPHHSLSGAGRGLAVTRHLLWVPLTVVNRSLPIVAGPE